MKLTSKEQLIIKLLRLSEKSIYDSDNFYDNEILRLKQIILLQKQLSEKSILSIQEVSIDG